MEKQFTIRPIQKDDNTQIKAIIREVFEEMGVPKTGTAYEDKSLDDMYSAYQQPRAAYFVVVYKNRVIGGAGVAPLENYEGNVCELQKMYFSEEARGKGIGKQMLKECLDTAKSFGFEGCYLETMPYMDAAQKLYKKHGFVHIDAPMGCTGHTSCPVYMFKSPL